MYKISLSSTQKCQNVFCTMCGKGRKKRKKHANNLTSEHQQWERAHLLEISYGWKKHLTFCSPGTHQTIISDWLGNSVTYW